MCAKVCESLEISEAAGGCDPRIIYVWVVSISPVRKYYSESHQTIFEEHSATP